MPGAELESGRSAGTDGRRKVGVLGVTPGLLDVRLIGGNGTSPACWAILSQSHGGRHPKGKSFLPLFLNTSTWVPSLAAPNLLRAGRANQGEKNTGMG